MSVEASVFSPKESLSEGDLRDAVAGAGIALRLLDRRGQPMDAVPSGPLEGDFIAIGWPASDAATAEAVDVAIAAKDKPAIDQLGQTGRVGWCEFSVGPFVYDDQWKEFPDEREEYEQAIEPDQLAAIKACRTRYSLRSGLRPVQCAKLVDPIGNALKRATNGVKE